VIDGRGPRLNRLHWVVTAAKSWKEIGRASGTLGDGLGEGLVGRIRLIYTFGGRSLGGKSRSSPLNKPAYKGPRELGGKRRRSTLLMGGNSISEIRPSGLGGREGGVSPLGYGKTPISGDATQMVENSFA